MRIAVCIKQVQGEDTWLSPLDLHALEEALRIRDRTGASTVAVGVGGAEEALREALSYGVEEALLVEAPPGSFLDTLATSRLLAHALRGLGVDLILCGRESADSATGQVPPQLAALLEVPFATCVRCIRTLTEELVVVERSTEQGYEVVELGLPALLSVVRQLNDPRPPSLKAALRAKRARIPRLRPETAVEGRTELLELRDFGPARRGEILEDERALIERLEAMGVLS